MTIAALPMYDFEEVRWATDGLWAAIAARVPGAPAHLERQRPLEDVWADPALLLGQTCGYPLMTSLAGRVALVAVPRYRAGGCEGFLYRSAIVVRSADVAGGLADLWGRRCAVNSLESNSGMNVLRAAIAPLAQGGRFFDAVVMTGSHAASVSAVACGDADVAAIDCVTWAHLQSLRPGEVYGLRVLDWTAPSPGLPLITSVQNDLVTRGALADALHDVVADRTLAPVLSALLIEGFETVALRAYNAVLELEQVAYGAGYPALR